MATLQATWDDATLCVWGHEAPANGAVQPLMPGVLRAELAEWTPDPLLVAVPDAPLELQIPDPENGRSMPITAPALRFSAADALELLTGPHRHRQVDSASWRWWTHLATFTAGLLERRQFIPDIERSPEGAYTAVWRPHIATRDELAWLEQAITRMPGVCSGAVDDTADHRQTVRIVETFVEGAVDGFVRRTTTEDPFFGRIHEQRAADVAPEVRWLAALLGEDGALDGEDHGAFCDRVRSWTCKLDDIGSSVDIRVGFRLLEPDDNLGWRVGLELSSPEDGRHIDITQVWSQAPDHLALLRHHFGRRRDRLLADLDRAEEAFPPLSRLSRQRPPADLALSVDEAYNFLRQWAPVLQSRGFDVHLPEWADPPERLGLRLVVRTPSAPDGHGHAQLGLDQLVEFDWRIAVGEHELSREEFDALVTNGTPLVRYRDTWLQIDPVALERTVSFVNQPRGSAALRTALQLAHGIDTADTGLPVLSISGEGWLDEVLRQLPTLCENPPGEPPGFVGTLRPYQKRGLGWLALLDAHGFGSCLADDMGLGKTIQLIALLLFERAAGACGPTLLFTPTSVLGNWKRELERFAPQLRVYVHHGTQRLSGADLTEKAALYDVVMTTYALGARDHDDLSTVSWHRLVLDEAQKVKNPHAQQTLAIRGLSAPRRVALTGTPVENRLFDLWSIMEVLNPGLLGGPTHFRNHFAVPIEKMGDNRRAEQLRGLLRPFILRREKSDPTVICDLPARMDMRVFCNLTNEQAELYEQYIATMMTDIHDASGMRRRGLVLTLLTRLKQICNHPAMLGGDPALDGRSGKCERLVEMLEEVVAEGDSALIFTQYRTMGHFLEQLIHKHLPETGVQYLHGGTPPHRRQQMIDHFQEAEGSNIFLLSLRAGGFGLNLTAATHVFHFDRWWNPAVEDQATDRAHRVGQKRVVQVHKFVCLGTVEERIDRMLEEKKSMAERVVTSGEQFLVEMPTEALREYLQLGADAIG